ncbi:asparagine rich protein [Reticulomyxa filosa]|uniref:Asparagine rich protein n=1 Tax=Reticulomyxa filosa TaxID=46433 RepID=X6MNH7_RETFI|nr:asparagine rich protein [Reticulomyxa filosa]|eukprot:ETO15226.1 asparagine rich protein [Reticulomyxa filosa]
MKDAQTSHFFYVLFIKYGLVDCFIETKILKNRIRFNSFVFEVFLEFFNLPVILGERLFDVFDTKQDDMINFDKFYNRGTMKEKIDMLFEMYALNGQSYITKEQLQAVFFSLVTPTSGIFYSDDPIRVIGGSKVNCKKNKINLKKKKESKQQRIHYTYACIMIRSHEWMFRLAERTHKIVNELVDEAFLHSDQENADKLSLTQFWQSRCDGSVEYRIYQACFG